MEKMNEQANKKLSKPIPFKMKKDKYWNSLVKKFKSGKH